jgi:hypothetical protein
MAKGMVHRHLMSTVSEEWLIRTIDKRHEVIEAYRNVTTTITTTSVIFKDGVKILKKKKVKKTA